MRRPVQFRAASVRCSPFFLRPAYLTFIAIAGCGSNADGDSAPAAVSDSAGITIVDYASDYATTSQRRWHAGDAPVFTIGGTSLPLHRVIGPVFQSDGRFVVGNAGDAELLFFTPEGELLARTGGEGDGPGEFRGLSLLSVGAADSVLAYDRSERRASLYDPSGAFVRTVPMPDFEQVVSDVGMLGVTYVRWAGNGGMIVAVDQRTSGTALVRDSLIIITSSPADDRIDVLAKFPNTWRHWGPHNMPGHGIVAFPLPVPLSGMTAVAGHGASAIVATADRLSLTLLTPDGVQRITRVQQAPAAVTDAHRDALFGQLPAATQANPEMEVVRALDGPATLPAFGRGPITSRIGEEPIVVTDDGSVWLQPFSVGEQVDNEWPRFDAAGVYEGVVVMPEGFRPTAVRGDVMIGVYRDSLDVEYVRAYRIGEAS